MDTGKYIRKRAGRVIVSLLCIFTCIILMSSNRAICCQAEEAVKEEEATLSEVPKEQGDPKPVWEGDTIYCAAFGDSIAKGYAGRGQEDLRCYTQLIADRISEETEIPAECVKFAKNGLDSSGLNATFLVMDEALAALDQADIITLTIGANDLMQEFKKAAQEVLGTDRKFLSVYDAFDALQEGVEENPLLIMKVLDVLNNWDYDVFEEQWKTAMETISGHRKDTAQLIVTNIYNPVSQFELPGGMTGIVEDIIRNMNMIMYEYAEVYDYRIVDLFGSDICGHTQEDGLHPDQEGQELIAMLAFEKIDTGRFMGEPKKEIAEEPRPEKTDRRRYSLWTILGPAPLIVSVILAGTVIVALVWLKMRKKKDLYR